MQQRSNFIQVNLDLFEKKKKNIYIYIYRYRYRYRYIINIIYMQVTASDQ